MSKKAIYIILILVLSLIITGLVEIMKLGIKNDGFIFRNELIKQKEYEVININNIDIDLSSSNIEVYLSDNDKIKIEQYGNQKTDKYIDEISEETIKIKEKIRIFEFFIHHTEYKIYLPKNYLGNLNLKSVSGDILVENISDKIKDIELKTTSGNIKFLVDINSESLNLKSVSGDIELLKVDTKDISIKTTSGNIKTEIINAITADLKSVSGDIKANSLTGLNNVATTSGNIRVLDLICLKNSNISTISGDVSIKMNNDSNCAIDISTVSGDKNLRKNTYGNGNYKLKIETTSGNIKVD